MEAVTHLEIERKWLVEDPSPLKNLPCVGADCFRQGYLRVGNPEVRIRITDRSGSFLTVKEGDGLSRSETEVALDESAANALLRTLQVGSTIFKKRTRYRYASYCLAFDEYVGHLAGLYLFEIEFPSEKAAQDFRSPPWFGRDVTADLRYKNKNLALKGLP